MFKFHKTILYIPNKSCISCEINVVTLDRRHFLDDAAVAHRSGLRLGTPGDALAWVRGQLANTD
jgi:hypothetical protein